MKKQMRTIMLGLGLAAMTAATSQAADYHSRIIRFGYGLSADSNQGKAADFFAKDLAKRTDGKLKVKGFGNASLGSDIQMQNALIGGAQEMMVGSTATLVGIDSDFGVYDLPFLFSNTKEADTILDGPFGQKLLNALQAKGLVGIVYWENGFRNLTNSVRPIKTVADLKGIKLRVMQNPMYIDMFDRLGANAVPMSFSELFTALETHTVDGQENPVNTIESSKFYEVQKYLSLTKHVYSPWVMLASKAWWDKLTPDEHKAITEAAIDSRKFERDYSRSAQKTALTFLKKHGMQVTVVSDAQLAKMRELAKPEMEKFAAAGHEQEVKTIEADLAKLRN